MAAKDHSKDIEALHKRLNVLEQAGQPQGSLPRRWQPQTTARPWRNWQRRLRAASRAMTSGSTEAARRTLAPLARPGQGGRAGSRDRQLEGGAVSWLKVTGMIPAEAGNAWVSGTITATPARAEDEGWADGTRRAVWPMEGVLAGAGTRFEGRTGGDFYLPGANIGESVDPPIMALLAELKDQQGRTHRFSAKGKVAASALGEWSVNAPLGRIVQKVQNFGPNSWLETTVADLQAASMSGMAP